MRDWILYAFLFLLAAAALLAFAIGFFHGAYGFF